MATNIEKIKERVDIVELISSYLKLQKSGVNYKANCPFHGEKTPSFYVSPERQIWHCFGCGLGGSIFDFVMHIDGLEFGEAMRLLARRAGVELEQFDQTVQSEKGRLLEVVDWASKFFQKQLWESNAGLKALAYLKERGLSEPSIKQWQLGFAPESWDSLGNFLQAKRYRASEIFNSGLSVKRERGDGYYDRFRSRIVFPVVDLNSQTVGFSGRIFRPAAERPNADVGEDGSVARHQDNLGTGTDNVGHRDAKYINTPQTLIYDKSRVLYGLNQAKVGLRSADKCLVVEGNMDVIMSHQAGATQAVASSGTALTDQHLKIIKRYTSNLDFCFDMDAAGTLATERAITAAIRQGFNLGVVMLNDPGCKDPADYVKQHGNDWAEYAKQSQPIFSFYLESGMRAHDASSAIGKKLIADKVLAIIKHINNKVELAHWLGELALRLGIKEEVLREQMENLSANASEEANSSAKLNLQVLAKLGANTLEDYLVSLLLLRPELAESVESDSGNEFYSANTKALLQLFRDYLKARNQLTENTNLLDYLTHHLESVPGVEAMYLETIYIQAQETWQDFGPEDLTKEFNTVLYFLNKRVITAQLSELEMKIKQAEHRGEKNLVTELIKGFQTLSNQLIKLKY